MEEKSGIRPYIRVRLAGQEPFFGKGTVQILHGIEETGLCAYGMPADGHVIQQGLEDLKEDGAGTGLCGCSKKTGRTGRRKHTGHRAGEGSAGPF